MTTLREALRAPMRVWLTLTHLTVLTIPVLLLIVTGQVRADRMRQAGAAVLGGGPLTTLVVATVFATSLLALWAADQFTRSLRVLTEEASRVAEGDLNAAHTLGRPTRSSVREVHALAQSVERMGTRLDSRMRVLQEVSSGVAHELRTPLSTLIGTVELLEDESMSPEDRRRFLARASEQLARLRAIVDGVLALSRADRPTSREVVSLDAIATEHAADDVTVDGHAGPVAADPAALRLAIDNLIRNARQHGVLPITVRGWRDGEHAGVDVIDAGPGLSPELAARVFERFYTTDRAQGLGLGLSIVAAVAEAHGGSVRVEPGAPTRFRLTLPAART